MNAISPPIIRPKGFGGRSKNYWTLHSGGNDIFTVRLNEEARLTVVGFKNMNEATMFGKMIETYYIQNNEWPTGNLEFLPKSEVKEVSMLHIHKWEMENLKILCVRNIMDMVSVDRIIDTGEGYSVQGDIFRFDADTDFYRERFEEFMGM